MRLLITSDAGEVYLDYDTNDAIFSIEDLNSLSRSRGLTFVVNQYLEAMIAHGTFGETWDDDDE